MSIVIFSKPTHSGKTTALIDWCSQQKNIAGIVMPDIDGKRKMLDIKSKHVFDAEYEGPGNILEQLTSIGRFHFYTTAFDKANTIITAALNENCDWLIIDEVGKLELGRKGFYDAVQKTIDAIESKKFKGNLLLVVRDSLVKDVVEFFKISRYDLISRLS